MVVEKQQERHTNDKKRKFRRPFQRSPTNGAQKGSISKEKDNKVHSRYVSTNANTGGDLHSNQAEGNVAGDSKDVNGSSAEITNSHGGSSDYATNNEPRLSSHKQNGGSCHTTKSNSSNDGGTRGQNNGIYGDSSENVQSSAGTNTFVIGNEDDSKQSNTKSNKVGKAHQSQQQGYQNQQYSNQHSSKQANQRQATYNFQQKHQTHPSSNHNPHNNRYDGRYNQDRRGRGYGYSGNKHRNQAGSSGGGYDSNRKQHLTSSGSTSGGSIGGNSYGSQSRPSQHGKPQQQQLQSDRPSNTSINENTGNINAAAETTSSASAINPISSVSTTANAANNVRATNQNASNSTTTTTAKEEGGRHYSSQNNGVGTSRKDFHGTPNRRGGDAHHHNNHGRQQGPPREHQNHPSYKDGIGKGSHGSHQKDHNDGMTKESRSSSHKSSVNGGKPGAVAAMTAAAVTSSDSERRHSGGLDSKQKTQTYNQAQAKSQSQQHHNVSRSQQGGGPNSGSNKSSIKGDSGGQRSNTEHTQNSNTAVTNEGAYCGSHQNSNTNHHNNAHSSGNYFPNNGVAAAAGGASAEAANSWKGSNGGYQTYSRQGKYLGSKHVGKNPGACGCGGLGQNLSYPKQQVEGTGGYNFGQSSAGGALSEDLRRKKNKKKLNGRGARSSSGSNGGGGQIGGAHQVGAAQVRDRHRHVSGEQLKSHNEVGETCIAASADESESRNNSFGRAQNGSVNTQHMSVPGTESGKVKVSESRGHMPGGLNESDNPGAEKGTSGSDRLGKGGSHSKKSDGRNATAGGSLSTASAVEERPDLRNTISCSETSKNLGSSGSGSETAKEGGANSNTNNTSASAASDTGTGIASISSNTDVTASGVNGGSGGVVGPWRRTTYGGQTVDSLETVRRAVKSLLNKITVEKFTVIAEKLAVCIDEIKNVDELEELVKQVLDKAITEPDFSEMYADLCQILKWRSPVLVNRDGKSSIGFSRALLARCEQEFKNMPRNMTPTEEERGKYDSDELAILYRKRKLHVLGIIRLIGELFIRKMFPMRSLNELVFDLVMIQENPDEYAIECLCQLIMTTGYYLDSNEKSQMIVDQWFGRLRELQNTSISTRLNCLIQDVFDLRKHKWVKKVHKQKAKALADILKDIDVEDVLGGAAIAAQYGSVVVVGERSNLVGNSAYYNYMTSQEELYISKQKSLQKQ